MSTAPTSISNSLNTSSALSGKAIAAAIGALTGAYPNPDDPIRPGPWDPIVRAALRHLGWAAGPFPDPWRPAFSALSILARHHPEILDLLGGPASLVALNPQPLPPGATFVAAVAQEVMQRAALIQETAETMARSGEERGIIIVGGYVARFVDDWCGNGFRLRFPIPIPPPPWFRSELSGADHILMGAQFHAGAAEAFNTGLGKVFANAGDRMIAAGSARLR